MYSENTCNFMVRLQLCRANDCFNYLNDKFDNNCLVEKKSENSECFIIMPQMACFI